MRILFFLMVMAAGLWITETAWAQGFQRVVLSSDASAPFGVAAGDFDNDGDVDAASTNYYSGSVVWIETMPGIPAAPHNLTVAFGSLRGIASGDFDSDGDLDLVIAAYDEDRFLLLENRHAQGTAAFDTHELRTGCNGAWSTIAVDLDLDGDMDLVTTEYLGNTVRIFLQVGGQLTEVAAFGSNSPIDAAVADLDGDGDRDILVASYAASMKWIENTGDGWTIHSLSIGTGRISVAIADLDNDGDADLIGASFNQGLVEWWERIPSGYTGRTLPGAMTNVRDIAVADFDMDGDMDIVASAQNGVLRWWENMGNRVFNQRTAEQGSSLYSLAVVDYDQDGDPDVVVADQAGSHLLLYRNTMGVPAVIMGLVRATANAQPVPGVRVQLIESGVSAVTGADGGFTLFTAPGSYSMGTSHPCWNPASVVGIEAVTGDTTIVDFNVVRPLASVPATSLSVLARNGFVTTVPLTVINSGDGVLAVSATASGEYANDPWLSVTPQAVEIPPESSLDLQVHLAPDTSNAQNWDYYGLLELRTNACPESVITVAVMAYVLDAAEPPDAMPDQLRLHEVYPNPFNAAATVRFALPHPQRATLSLYDVTGRRAGTLMSGFIEAGEHAVAIDGALLPSGVYVLVLETEQARLTRKALLLK